MPKSLTVMAAVVALMASGFSLQAAAPVRAASNWTEILKDLAPVTRMPLQFVAKADLLLPRKS